MSDNRKNFLKSVTGIFVSSLVLVVLINIYELNSLYGVTNNLRFAYISMGSKIVILIIAFLITIFFFINMFNKEVNFEHMTGLYSRKKLFADLNNLINKKLQFTVCYIDLNDFSLINNQYGHSVGDMYLIEFAKRILELKCNGMNGYRVGGDEFVIIITNYSKVDDCIKSIWDITKEEIKTITQNKMKFSFAMGVFENDLVSNADELLKKADCHMYDNKNNCRGRKRNET